MNRKSTKLLCFAVSVFLGCMPGLNAQQLDLQWVTPVSGKGGTIVTSSGTVDKNGNVFTVGIFRDSIEVTTTNGPAKLVSKGLEDMFVARINPSGVIEWIKQVGGKAAMGNVASGDLFNGYFFSIVADEKSNLYIAGSYQDTVDFDPGSGTALWSTRFYLGGAFPGQTPPMLPYENGFILQLNADGDFGWVRTLHGNANSVSGIALDPREGTLAVTGYFQDTVDFNDRKGTNLMMSKVKGRKDAFVAKYDTSGQFKWAKQLGGGTAGTEALGISINNRGYVFTTGIFSDSSDFDPGPGAAYLISTVKPAQNIFVSKLDATGNYLWAKAMGGVSGSSGARGSAIATDHMGNVFTTGYIQGTSSLDPTNNSMVFPTANLSYFISKLDSTGNYVWGKILERPVGKPGADWGRNVAVDDDGDVYTTGHFMNEIYLDPDPAHTSRAVFAAGNGATDAFLLKLQADGSFLWGKQIRSSVNSRGMHVMVGQDKSVYLSGYFGGTTEFNPSGNSHQVTAANSSNLDGFTLKLYCMDTTSSVVAIAQCGDSLEYNGVVYNSSGDYVQVLRNAVGCDSTLNLSLTLYPIVPAVITVDGFELGTTASFKTYQWLWNDQPIPGANAPIYTVPRNGQYKVVVTTEHDCVDTSEAYTVTNGGSINEVDWTGSLKLYPNPASDRVHVYAPLLLDLQVVSLEGKLLYQEQATGSISLKGLAAGIYFIRISDVNGNLIKVEKIIKE